MRKLWYAVILVLVLALTFRVQLSIKANPSEIHVPDDYEKIQWAIGNATAGDTIRVHAGTYYEHVVVDKQLSLIGDGIRTTTIDGSGIGTIVKITSSNVIVTGFTIRNSGPNYDTLPPYIPDSGIYIYNQTFCQVRNNYLDNCTYGVYARLSSNCTILHNTVHAIRAIALDFYVISSTNVTDNIITNCYSGLRLSFVSNSNFANNIFSNITPGWAFYLVESSGNNVMNNSIENCWSGGFSLFWSSNNYILFNSIKNCSRGISYQDSNNTVIKRNNIENCSVALDILTQYDPPPHQPSNLTIQGNRIENCTYGIGSEYGPASRQFFNSTVFHNSLINVQNPTSLNVSKYNAWDLGWPDGGNYWGGHDNSDVKSGPNQLGPGSDAISDTPFVIDANNTDRFPCAGPINYFDVFYTQPEEVVVISNSTVADFQFNKTKKTVKFKVSGDSGVGLSRVDMPNNIVSGLWQNSYKVLVDGVPIDFGNWTAGSKTYIYFRYQHSTKEITIAPEGDEYFNTVIHTPFDDSDDGFNDSVEVMMDVDTTYNGTVDVSVDAYLIDPNGIYVAFNTTGWTINYMAFDWGFVNLHVPPGYPIGNYSVELYLYDGSQLEDYRYDNDVAYLFPPFVRELTIETVGSGTTYPPPGSYLFPNGTEVPVEAFPDAGWMLSYWMLDSVNVGADNPIPVLMDNDHLLTVVFVEIPPDMRELLIEIVGNGSTTPTPGNHVYPLGDLVNVQAIPDAGWVLDHWLLDSVYLGPDNPIPFTMDTNHGLTAVFVETPPEQATIESCNATGTQKNIYNLDETVYVNGSGYSPSTTYDIYMVEDVVTWIDAMPIPSRVLGTATTISSNIDGDIPPTAVWSNPQTFGKYDIVVDVNANGVYDAEIDALDDSDIEVTAGFVIPEFPSFLIPPLFMITTLITVMVYRRKHST
ncbi:MAG: right-handed parallel beta-helix repeat-containing protein [Candidatus Bathyarchaeota archaeon]|nr:right-handed parallel beta-helix repeat-containing protein [Candidatus Bathyarchaeota archaeon]